MKLMNGVLVTTLLLLQGLSVAAIGVFYPDVSKMTPFATYR